MTIPVSSSGEKGDPGDLTTAYTTIDSNGSIVMQNIQQGKSIKLNSDKNNNKGFDCSSITEQSIRLYDDNGRPYIDISGHAVAGDDFVTLTNSYNNKGLHLKRINNASSDDILYILDGLPTSDPKIEGALWMDSDRTLKVSSR
jgi:hypothetical protein